MIHFKIKEQLLSRGVKFPAVWLMKNCGFSKTKALKLVNAKQDSIKRQDIAIMCERLNCSPNEFFYWEQRPGHILPEGHPCLTLLKAPTGDEDWHKIFSKLSPETMMELHGIAVDRLKKV